MTDQLEPFREGQTGSVRAVAEEPGYSGNKPGRRLDTVTLPVVDAGFIHPDPLRGLLLEQSQVKPLSPDVVAISSEGRWIRLRLALFGQ